MLFNSWQFALFFPLVFAVFWAVPDRFRTGILFVASCYFYMSWNVKYIVLILFTICVSYAAAILLAKAESQRTKKVILTASLIACLSVLFVFKYFNFFTGAVVDFLNMFAIHLHPVTLKLLLPVGISFYTFQTLGYVIDVYRGNVKPERNFLVYATFISYFPQLVAGPIERTNNLLPQIKSAHKFNYEQASYGIKLMTWGFFKKLCVADVLAPHVDWVFNDIYNYRGFSLVLAVFFFTVQIYCDFSGYSDIARGCSKMLGIDLMENFKSPYFSASLREFWSRWHISLSTWFRDYVYIPLGGNRCGKLRHNVNLLLTFIVSGLWHGANFTFIVWGAVHGLGQVCENALGIKRETHGLVRAVRVLITFTFVMLAWVFFRAQSINEAVFVLVHMFDPRRGTLGMERYTKIIEGILILILFAYEGISLKTDAITFFNRKSFPVRWTVYILLGLMVIFLSTKDIAEEFVYFQF